MEDILSQVSLTEAQLHKAKLVEDESRFFHSEDKGCQLKETKMAVKSKGGLIRFIPVMSCLTHEIDVCRCGWEFGHHWNTHSKLLYNAKEEAKKKTIDK